MPYRNEVRPLNLFGDFVAGQNAAIDQESARQGNALRGLQVQRAQGLNALARDPSATPEQYARAGDPATAGVLNTMNQQGQIDKMQAVQQLAGIAQKALTITDPAQRKGFLQQTGQIYGPAFQALGADMSQFPAMLAMPDDQLAQKLQQVAQFAAPLQAKEGFTLSDGQTRFDASGNVIARVAAKPEKSAGTFKAMTPAEIAAAGLPAGTSAQRDTVTGKIDVLSKRDNTGVLSQKDATTAKMKLNTVALARQQLNKIRDAFEGEKDPKTGQRTPGTGIQGTLSAGPSWTGQGIAPTEAGKKFDQRVNQMRSTLTALTRVPGVGAMSDYETKLDQAKFPTRGEYESVTLDTLNNLDDQLSLIETGYRDLLTGSAPSSQTAPQPAQGGPVRVSSPQEAMALPSGTQFVTPDGRVKVRP